MDLMKKTTLYSFAFLTVAMCAIVYFSANKTITISDVAQDEVIAGEDAGAGDAKGAENIENASNMATAVNTSNELTFSDEDSDKEYLIIPVPVKTEADDITIENHYMDRELYILVNGAEEEFYKNGENVISGNRTNITDGTFDIIKGDVRLRLSMNGVYEYKTVLENDCLYITFYNPKELYDKVIVIDPACGGSDTGVINTEVAASSSINASKSELAEKDITLAVAKALKEKLDAEDNLKVYYTRMDDTDPSEDMRTALANDSKADAYIRIEVSGDSDTSLYGITTKYNDEYFIPGFGNVELSDLMESSVTTAVKGRALGLKKATNEDATLLKMTVPSCSVMVGCINNKQEAILLSREDYIDKIAQGLYDGIIKIGAE